FAGDTLIATATMRSAAARTRIKSQPTRERQRWQRSQSVAVTHHEPRRRDAESDDQGAKQCLPRLAHDEQRQDRDDHEEEQPNWQRVEWRSEDVGAGIWSRKNEDRSGCETQKEDGTRDEVAEDVVERAEQNETAGQHDLHERRCRDRAAERIEPCEPFGK